MVHIARSSAAEAVAASFDAIESMKPTPLAIPRLRNMPSRSGPAAGGSLRVPDAVADGALAVVCLAAGSWSGLQSGLFDGETPWVAWNAPFALEVAAGATSAASMFVRRRWPLVATVCALLAWCIACAWPALLIAQYGVGAYLRSTRLRVVATVVTVVALGWPMWRIAGPDGSLPLSAMLCVLPALVGLYLTSRREFALRNQREESLRIDQARAEERSQIARDMHDVVTHRVSLMVLHATALEAADDGRDTAEIAQRIQLIGRTALDELRTLVGVLRDGSEAPLRPQPGLADLAELVTASRELGLTVDLHIEPDLHASSMVEHAAYRVVQEALTNIHRHAPGAATTVTVEAAGAHLNLTVHNNKPPVSPVFKEARRHGLLGIGERVRLVGGTLSTRRLADGGFEVVALMPLATSVGRR